MAITLIKETGTGLSDANVYADLTDLALVAELTRYTLPVDEEDQKSALYIAANQYIDRLHEFKGEKIDVNQGMSLYTNEVTFADASKNIIQANCEAAILHLQGFLFVSPTEQSAKGNITMEKSKLDVLEEEFKYEEGTRVTTKYNTSNIDRLLAPYIKVGTGGVALRVV